MLSTARDSTIANRSQTVRWAPRRLRPSPAEWSLPMRPQSLITIDRQRLQAAATAWLFGGSVLLLTTLVPLHTERLGWTPAFWLAVAPLIALLGLEPGLPRRLLARRRPRRPLPHHAIWH
jgi:hypothetical protein